ncbi:synaptopodin-2 isoform X2 [Hippocampus zosterae]|uniref:synaptopodin-2 isoform X2 n=1 Tax=Hippocampus zosterae TaxID=109293 RepID=UPI00223E6133|nr:synaptopodin-2 isoform X2 [Hippocampus zosterae]
MGTGDYICITLHGDGPWGFTLQEGVGDTDTPLLVSQVEEGGNAFQAGVRDGDEVVSLNGKPCAGLSLCQAQALINASVGCLRLLLKRSRGDEEALKLRELYISESQEEISDEEPHGDPGDTPLLSLSQQTLDNMSCTSLGSAHGAEGEHTTQEAPPSSDRKPLSHHGVVRGKEPAASASPGRGILSGGVGGPGANAGSRDVGGGPCELPGSFSVAFQIPSDEGTPGEEQDTDSDQEKPNKHRARHARFRRSESLSEKQVKEAKSKCKRIALLLSAAQPNPNNKGLLMFKKHRQRAKKYTLVSYGTGEDKQHDSTEEEDDDDSTQGGVHVLEFTLADQDRSDLETHFLTNARSGKGVLTICLDKSLLDVEQKQSPMERLPETKGKGALMFAQRRQRMDEIAAEHEELRRKGIPVEGAQNVEAAYTQPAVENHAYMDVNQQQQYQQYQEQQYQQYQQRQYQQQEHYQQNQQQPYEQQQTYHQVQRGSVQQQSHEAQRSLGNRTAKPFLVQNMAATPYSPAMTGTNQGQGEQIASRDERIATPAIRSGLLDSKRRNVAKPMFTFKETPKMSPNPDLLNLLNMSTKKMGFESGPEEDYLSLGAEACNFLQSSRSKHKTPPPVAPKPVIDPSSAPWSPQMEVTNQDMPQHAENSVPTPAVAPTAVTTPLSDQEPTSHVNASGPTPPQAQLEVPAIASAEQQQTWPPSMPETQQPQVAVQEGNCYVSSSPQPETNAGGIWDSAQAAQQQSTISCYATQVQPREPQPSQSSLQHQWVTPQSTHSQVQSQPPADTWTPQNQASWSQTEQAQPHVGPCQPQDPPQSQPQQNWTHSPEPQVQQMQPTWGRSREPMLQQQQQSQASWGQAPQVDSQPTWALAKSQEQASWIQPESQPAWGQPMQPKAWPQTQAPDQHWAPAQPQAQPPINNWPPAQPSWTQTAQAQPQMQPPAGLSPWPPVPAQPSWAQQPPEQVQRPTHAWQAEQGPARHLQSWDQSVHPQTQPNWQQAPLKTAPQPLINAWPPAQPETPAWAPQSQQTPVANTQPSPKPWQTQQNRGPQRSNAFTSGQKGSNRVINPLATVLNPSSASSAYEMPAVRGKGADMFAKRQSRMEKYVVDSETVQAHMASRSTSPTASLPNEWKYTPNVTGRSYSLSPPGRAPSTGRHSPSSSARASRQATRLEKTPKALTPWEAASRHPLGLVDEAFAFQDLQQNLASSVHLAAQRKLVPEPPAQWTARACPQRAGGQRGWGPGQGGASSTGERVGYGSLPRKWQPQRSESHSGLLSDGKRSPVGLHKSPYSPRCNWQQ